MMRPTQAGSMLLAVSILLAMVAALAFTLNREGTGASRAVDARYDAEVARYLAEAAVARATWVNQTGGCGNGSVAAVDFGGGQIEAAVKKGVSKTLDIVATGTTGAGASFTITRKGPESVVVRNLTKTTPADLGGAAVDTYIAAGTPKQAYGAAATLELVSATSNVLLSWPANELPADVLVMSATLILRQSTTSSTVRPVSVHRVLRAWDANATWEKGTAAWTSAGGDYSGAVATASVASTAVVNWDVTALVDGWVNGSIVNNGMLLKMVNGGQSASFHSLQAATTANRPVLRVTYAKPC